MDAKEIIEKIVAETEFSKQVIVEEKDKYGITVFDINCCIEEIITSYNLQGFYLKKIIIILNFRLCEAIQQKGLCFCKTLS